MDHTERVMVITIGWYLTQMETGLKLRFEKKRKQMEMTPIRFGVVVEIVAIASLVTGIVGLLVAVLAAFRGGWVGGGVCLVANGILRA